MLSLKLREFIKKICFWIACTLIVDECGYPSGFWWNFLFVVMMMVPYYLVFPMESKSDTEE